MKILEKAITPDGIEIQLEDWREHNTKDYPNLHGCTIGAYPMAKNSGEYKWVESGETFRLSIPTNNYAGYTSAMVLDDFEALRNGKKKLEDLAEHFGNGLKDMYYLGMDDESKIYKLTK